MSETRDRPSFDFLARALRACRAEGTTGSLYLAGRPGGVFHLREGAVGSPGAPGPDALLLRSGRIREDDWSAVLRADGTASLGDLLGGGIGAAELRLVATAAAQDSAFAVVAGTIHEYAVDRDLLDVPVPVSPGRDVDRLLPETRRRIDAPASLPTPVSPYRERLVPVPAAPATNRRRRDIVACANGRRCARDIAFLLGRNVFPVTVEVSRLVGDGPPAAVALPAATRSRGQRRRGGPAAVRLQVLPRCSAASAPGRARTPTNPRPGEEPHVDRDAPVTELNALRRRVSGVSGGYLAVTPSRLDPHRLLNPENRKKENGHAGQRPDHAALGGHRHAPRRRAPRGQERGALTP
ncbi:hypothetical protein [Amycolatopsis sp. NPDC049159]|uniref:hypothetical protein n=1 Tax=Amycolatopsis sp. NPDC049159 TaxID=3157210 RepID=UPI00340B5D29